MILFKKRHADILEEDMRRLALSVESGRIFSRDNDSSIVNLKKMRDTSFITGSGAGLLGFGAIVGVATGVVAAPVAAALLTGGTIAGFVGIGYAAISHLAKKYQENKLSEMSNEKLIERSLQQNINKYGNENLQVEIERIKIKNKLNGDDDINNALTQLSYKLKEDKLDKEKNNDLRFKQKMI